MRYNSSPFINGMLLSLGRSWSAFIQQASFTKAHFIRCANCNETALTKWRSLLSDKIYIKQSSSWNIEAVKISINAIPHQGPKCLEHRTVRIARKENNRRRKIKCRKPASVIIAEEIASLASHPNHCYRICFLRDFQHVFTHGIDRRAGWTCLCRSV